MLLLTCIFLFFFFSLRCDNVFLKDAAGDVVKIGDLGLTRPAQPGTPFSWGTDEKTPKPWYPPEAIRSFHFYLEQSDMWSFGCVLFEIFSRCESPPWFNEAPGGTQIEKSKNWVPSAKKNILDKDTRLRCPTECPPEWWDVFQTSMEFDPMHRPTFEEMNGRIRGLSATAGGEVLKPAEPVLGGADSDGYAGAYDS
jgi:serine/threonine protein kinase